MHHGSAAPHPPISPAGSPSPPAVTAPPAVSAVTAPAAMAVTLKAVGSDSALPGSAQIIYLRTPEAPPGWGSVFMPFVPAIMTIVGWYILYRQAEFREKRKRFQDLIGSLRLVSDKVGDHCAKYWITELGHERRKEAVLLKASIQTLSEHVQIMKDSGFDADVSPLVVSVRKTATGGEFEVKGRKRKEEDDERVADVNSFLEDIVVVMYREYHRIFPAKKPPILARIKLVLSGISKRFRRQNRSSP